MTALGSTEQKSDPDVDICMRKHEDNWTTTPLIVKTTKLHM